MQYTASLPADRFDDPLRRLPTDLDALARQTKAVERKHEIGSGTQVMRLALARGPGGLSLSQTAAWASMLGMAEISDPAVKYRLDKPAPAKLVPAKLVPAKAGGRALALLLSPHRAPHRLCSQSFGDPIRQPQASSRAGRRI